MDDLISDVKRLLEEDDPSVTVEEVKPPQEEEKAADETPIDRNEELALG